MPCHAMPCCPTVKLFDTLRADRWGCVGSFIADPWRLGWDGMQGGFCSKYREYLQKNQRRRPPKPSDHGPRDCKIIRHLAGVQAGLYGSRYGPRCRARRAGARQVGLVFGLRLGPGQRRFHHAAFFLQMRCVFQARRGGQAAEHCGGRFYLTFMPLALVKYASIAL